MPSSPPKPPAPPQPLDDLPEFADSTDALELLVDLDPGAPEPEATFEFEEDDLLSGTEEQWVLGTEEPAATAWPEAQRPAAGAFVEDDLEDFATKEELPILPWRIEVELLEIGRRLPALLDPTRETSSWERPDGPAEATTLTVRIRMLDLPVTLEVVHGDTDRLRLGRDVLGGRILVAAD